MQHSKASKLYHDYTLGAWEHGGLSFRDDEKALREHFHDNKIELRWNTRRNVWQIWYGPDSGLYCICDIPYPYSLGKAKHYLQARDMDRKELQARLKLMHEQDRAPNPDDEAFTLEMAKAIEDHYKGKVVTSGI